MRRVVLVMIVALGFAGLPARAAEVTPQTLVEIPTTDITAIELHRTPCFGDCPSFTLRLTADGRAHFVGRQISAVTPGVLDAHIDFRTLAAWVVSQHLETLALQYALGMVDAPGIDIIERPTGTTRYHSNYAVEIPLRLEGVVLALEGEMERARWRKEDALTPFFGEFTNGERELYVDDLFGATAPPQASGTAVRCAQNVLAKSGDAVSIRCDERGVSTLVPTADGFTARGDAIERVTTGAINRARNPARWAKTAAATLNAPLGNRR